MAKGGGTWRRKKKVRLAIIIGLIVVAALVALLFEKARLWMVGVIIVLLAALGLEVANTDVDLGTVVETGSVSEAVIERDSEGNLMTNEAGDLVTRFLRDKQGNIVPEGTEGAKYTDEYNCDDFATQAEAQLFFDNMGGVDFDVNRLDGNKDGIPCQSLP